MATMQASPAGQEPVTTFWDPVRGTVTKELFRKENAALQQKLANIRAHPERLRQIRTLLWTVAIIISLAVVFFATGGAQLVIGNLDTTIDLRLLIVPFIAPFLYIAYIRNLQRDLVCSLFAETHGWIYNPGRAPDHAKLLEKAFPALFQKGHSQYVEDEFWGSAEIEGMLCSFWKAPFTYTVGSGKHAHTYHQDAVAFRLPKTVHAVLILSPEGLRLFGDGRDDIQTESMQFNRTFTIRCPGMDPVKKERIVRALSPAVQTRLLDLRATRGAFSLQLEGDTIVFCFSRARKIVSFTNFFRKVDIDPRDIEALDAELRGMLGITAELLRYLD